MSESTPTLTVAVCTRGRTDKVRATLDALDAGAPGVPLLVIDQGAAPDAALAERAAADLRLSVIHDGGRGLSRARNLALAAVEGDWIAFVDDDCLVAADFGSALLAEIAAHPAADWIAGDVRAGTADVPSGLPPVTTFPVDRPLIRRGGRTLPGAIGFGVLFCVRRSTAVRLGGWDERLGPGVPDLPAADDMDFNHRLLRSGATAVLSPAVRAVHDQWRSPDEVVELQRGYSRAWAGFACKHLGRGSGGGLRLWAWGVVDILDMAASAADRRSPLRARIALAKLRGLIEGTALGLPRRW
ncbi:MAG TPA: glycosyltransferase family A protein [Thermoleophilaceae bacterium]|nr:glycosyltransferase family A protein [Thermoleophilaceae bacterium]